MDQRYGTEVWNGSFKEVWNGGMERGYGTGVVPELVPDLLFWLAPICQITWNIVKPRNAPNLDVIISYHFVAFLLFRSLFDCRNSGSQFLWIRRVTSTSAKKVSKVVWLCSISRCSSSNATRGHPLNQKNRFTIGSPLLHHWFTIGSPLVHHESHRNFEHKRTATSESRFLCHWLASLSPRNHEHRVA